MNFYQQAVDRVAACLSEIRQRRQFSSLSGWGDFCNFDIAGRPSAADKPNTAQYRVADALPPPWAST
jgi:hypothetical protein